MNNNKFMKITPELSEAIHAAFPLKPVYDYSCFQHYRDKALAEFRAANPEAQKLLDTVAEKKKEFGLLQRELSEKFGLDDYGYIRNEEAFKKAGGRIIAPAMKLSASQVIEIIARVDEQAGVEILKTHGIKWG